MIEFPAATAVHRRLPKEAFYKHLPLTKILKEKFVSDVDRIVVENSFTKENLNLASDAEIKEIMLLSISLKNQEFDGKVIEAIARQNPHKLVFLLSFEDQQQLAVYHNKLYRTLWIDHDAITLKLQGYSLDEIWDFFIEQIALYEERAEQTDDLSIEDRLAIQDESVLIFVKDYLNTACILGVEKEGKMVDEYNKEDERGKYRLIGLRNRNQAFNPITRPNLYYPLYVNPSNKKVSTKADSEFTDEVWPDTPDGIKTCWTWMSKKVDEENNLITAELSGGEWRIFRKDYLISEDGKAATTLIKSIWTENIINNDYGKKSIKELFGCNVMSFPKPPELIKRMIAIGSRKDSIVMDFFSGSATTAQAVMQINSETNENRHFIMVQLPEICAEKTEAFKAGYKTICDIGEERIRRAGRKIKEKSPLTTTDLDIGFRVFKVDSSNMEDVYYRPADYNQGQMELFADNIKPDRTPEDLLFQVMLDLGILLSSDIQETEIAGKKVFSVADGYLIACFDKDVTEETVKAIAQKQPVYAVFRDSSMASDSVAANFEQIFETYSPRTQRKVL